MASNGKRKNSGTLQNGLKPPHKKNRPYIQYFRCPMCKSYKSELYNSFWEDMGLAPDPYLRASNYSARNVAADTGHAPVRVDMPRSDEFPVPASAARTDSKKF